MLRLAHRQGACLPTLFVSDHSMPLSRVYDCTGALSARAHTHRGTDVLRVPDRIREESTHEISRLETQTRDVARDHGTNVQVLECLHVPEEERSRGPRLHVASFRMSYDIQVTRVASRAFFARAKKSQKQDWMAYSAAPAVVARGIEPLTLCIKER